MIKYEIYGGRMKFIAREEELAILEKEYVQPYSSFIAVYGRRRVGKTELIDHFLSSHKPLIFSVTGAYDATKKSHLNNFSNKLSLAFGCEKIVFSDWDEAFYTLQQEIEKVQIGEGSKFIIFIDELPWLAQLKNKGFKSALSLFWNDFASKREDIFLIICGSATSWIINHIIQDHGSLANRVTNIIHLQAFTLKETKEFLLEQGHKSLTDKMIVDYYMVLGGVAHYLKLLDKEKSFVQNINNLFFKHHAILRVEYHHLFATLFKNHQVHEEIIDHLSDTWSGMTLSSLAKKKGLKLGSVLSNGLRELEESGFVIKRQKYGQKKRDMLYSISDPFIFFFRRWVENISLIELRQNQNYFQTIYSSGAYKVWSGFAFENICHLHIYPIKYELGISGVLTHSYYWSAKDEEQGAQIDLLLERADDVINIIECKYHNKEFVIDKSYAKKLENKRELFYDKSKYNGSIMTVMISAYGVKENQYYNELITQSMTIDALFKK